MTQARNLTKVFDIPTRLFHWTFAALFISAFAIGKFVDDESAVFPYHSILGMLMIAVVAMRLVWGFVGSRYARFGSFKLNPIDLIDYLKTVASGKKVATLGRNPASSFAAFAMVSLAIGLGISGYMMASGANEPQGRDIKEVHEVLAVLFAVMSALHVVGIIVHTVSQKDPIGMAMVSGDKPAVRDEIGIERTHPLIGIVFVVVLAGFAFALNTGYDRQTRTLALGTQTLHLGESEADRDREQISDSEEADQHVRDD